MNSDSIDLIATDPPFDTKRIHNAPLGSRAAQQEFDDRWRWDDVTDEWQDLIAADYPAVRKLIESAVIIEGGTVDERTGKIDTGKTKNSVAAYIAWMAPRLIEMHRILKPEGTLYLHCNHAANSYLRLLLDSIFGKNRFRNEVIWCYRGGGVPKLDFARKHQTIFRYSKSSNKSKYVTFNVDAVRTGYSEIVQGRPTSSYDKSHRTNKIYSGYRLNPEGKHPDDWIEIQPINPAARNRSGWSTQKPLELYMKFIAASSNLGDIVLDPFAGCGTTCVVSEKLGRQWVGIDRDPEAENATANLLRGNTDLLEDNAERPMDNPLTVRKSPPKRKDIPVISDDRIRQSLWNRQGRKCANPYCNSHELRAVDIELDHRIPKSRGGDDDIHNRIALCGNCNRRKSAKAWGQFLDEERSKQPHPTR